MNTLPTPATVERLMAAGVQFGYRAFWLATGRTIPDGVGLFSLDPNEWDADFAPTWPILPDAHPDAAFVDSARDLYLGDGEYAAALEAALGELNMRDDT